MLTVFHFLLSAVACRQETDGRSTMPDQNERTDLNLNYSK